MTTFKQIVSAYDHDTLEAMTEHGCISGCAGDLIYYQDTNAYYDQFADELHEVLGNYLDQTGEPLPDYISGHMGNLVGFKNAVVWFVAEVYASEIVNA